MVSLTDNQLALVMAVAGSVPRFSVMMSSLGVYS
jgi:hypothetical protein